MQVGDRASSSGKLPIGELPFTDRTEDIHSLSDALTKVLGSKRGALALVLGEAGIGKTRFLLEFRKSVESQNNNGVRSLSAKCFRADDLAPYSPWVQLLREFVNQASVKLFFKACGSDVEQIVKLIPELSENATKSAPQASPGAEEEIRQRFLFFQSLTRFFGRLALESPLILFLDDLQWADPATVQLLTFFEQSALSTSPIFLVAACRDFEASADRNQSVVNFLNDVEKQKTARVIRLDRFDDARVGELLENASKRSDVSREFTSLIHSKTGGNPLFISEVLRSLFEKSDIFTNERGQWDRKPISEIEIPSTIIDVIKRRLDRLDPTSRDLLRIASVIGETFDTEVLKRLMTGLETQDGLDSNLSVALDIGIKSGLLEIRDKHKGEHWHSQNDISSVSFSDEAVHDVLYEEIAIQQRRELHHNVGLAFEALKSDSIRDYLSELAYHFDMGENSEKAFEYHMKAGDRASEVYAHEEAATHYKKALELTTRIGKDSELFLRAGLLSKLGEETYRYMGGNSGSEYLEEAAKIFEQIGQNKMAGAILMRLVEIYFLAAHDKERALAISDKAARMLSGETPSLELLFAMGVGYVLVNLWAGEGAKAREWEAKLEQLVKQLGDPKMSAIIPCTYVEITPISEKARVRDEIEKGLEYLIKRNDDIRMIIYDEFHLAVSIDHTSGPSKNSLSLLLEYEERAAKTGYFDLVFYYKGLICDDYITLGDWDNARKVVEEMFESLRRFPNNPTLYYMSNLFRGRVLFLEGELDKSQECLEIADKGTLLSPLFAQTAKVDLCRLYMQRGDFARAEASLNEAFNVSKRKGLTMFTSLRHAELVSLMIDLDVARHSSLEEARNHLQEMEETAKEIDEEWASAYLYKSKGVVAANQLDLQIAIDALSKSINLWEKHGWLHELAKTKYELALAYHKSNNFVEANRAVEDSLQIFRKLGAKIDLEKGEAIRHEIELSSNYPVVFAETRTRAIFGYLCDAFVQDNTLRNQSPESSGWRTLAELASNLDISLSSLYGKTGGQIGSAPMIKELLSNGYVEMKIFPGERGRGGEVTRFRIRLESEAVRNYAKFVARLKKERLP